MAHMTIQDVGKSENTMAKYIIMRCDSLRWYIKTFMYMLVQY